MVKLSIVLCVLAIFAFGGVNSASLKNAPAPAVDCSTILFSMADCLTFVTSGSKVTKPEGGCCSGLKTVLKTDAECLCVAFKNSGSLGVVLNVTKAATLPSACGVSAPSITKCGLSGNGSPGAAPAQSPESSAPSPKSSTPVSLAPTQAPASTTAGSQAATPAPSPSSSDASGFSISFIPLFVTLVAVWSSFF